MAEQILSHVRANAGQRLEEISVALRISTKDLKRPIANLMEAGKLRTEGQKRGTKYFAGSGGARRKARGRRRVVRRKTAGRARRKAARKRPSNNRGSKRKATRRKATAKKATPASDTENAESA